MKKKLAILLGVLAISSMSFGATDKKGTSSIENSLNNLEKQLTDLQKMEDQKFAQEEAKAAAAQQKNRRIFKNKIIGSSLIGRASDSESGGYRFESYLPSIKSTSAGMVELVDTLGLEPSALRCAGSSPVPGI